MKNNKTIAIIVASIVHSACLSIPAGEAAAATIAVDQSNAVGGETTRGSLTAGENLAQSFTPMRTSVDLFTASMASRGASTVQVRLFSGETTAGIPIASSSIVQLTGDQFRTVEFLFAQAIGLTPGARYTGRIDLLAGNSYLLEFSRTNPYSGGAAFNEFGTRVPEIDIVFAEGIVIAEPSSVLLLSLAVVGLHCRRLNNYVPLVVRGTSLQMTCRTNGGWHRLDGFPAWPS